MEAFTRIDDVREDDPVGKALLLLESAEDNPLFVNLVIEALVTMRPDLAGRIRRVPALGSASPAERARYLAATPVNWDDSRKDWLLAHMDECGQRVEGMDRASAFDHTRVARLEPSERLIEADAPSGFVYIPLDEGLDVAPLGGYRAFAVQPFMPLGATGVIRNGARNAHVIARSPLEVLIIPKEVYLQHWHRPWALADLRARLMMP